MFPPELEALNYLQSLVLGNILLTVKLNMNIL